MRILRLLVWVVMLAAGVCQAQTNQPAYAEAITPDIQALARSLKNDPLRIFNYVHDHIHYDLYFHSKKGAELTLLEKSGNDFDQCALLVALLRAASYTNAGYQFGVMLVPYHNPDGSQRDLIHWLGLNLTATNWSSISEYLGDLYRNRSYPMNASNLGTNTFAFQRVWVTLPIGGTNFLLDPAFKISVPISGINLASAMALNTNTLMTNAGGTSVSNYVQSVNEAAVRSTLAGYTSNLLGYLSSNCPNYSVEQVLGGQYIVPSTNLSLSTTTTFPTTNLYGTMPLITWTNEPTNLMAVLTITLAANESYSNVYQWFMPQLQGQCISLTVNGSGLAQLWQDTNLLTGTNVAASGSYFEVKLDPLLPHGQWITNGANIYTNTDRLPGSPPKIEYYKSANANYAILYAFDPDWGWLQQRQQKLDSYRQQGLPDTSLPVITETLNVMGLSWQLQQQYAGRMLAPQLGVMSYYPVSMGRMAQETGYGYYVDIYEASIGADSRSDESNTQPQLWIDHLSHFSSALEHGLIEQLQTSNLVAASTIKMLELNNTNGGKTFLVNSTNWTATQTQLTPSSYTSAELSLFGEYVSAGYTLLLPQNGNIQIAGTGSWAGCGAICRNVSVATMMLISDASGIHFGGYVSDLSALVNASFVSYSGYSQPDYFSTSPVSVPTVTAADPVNMADGTFQVSDSDLSVGQSEPRGIHFSRYYSSSRRNNNLAGLSPGWIHNYYLNAASISSPKAGLGGTTPAQAAPMLVATAASIALFNNTALDPKNWMVATLIAKWGVDQLTANAVSVSLGKDVMEFVKQPDGSFTPPANNTMSLISTNSGYALQERHGRSFNFGTNGLLTNIVNQYGQTLSVSYNTSNWVSKITDWKSNILAFGYSGSPLALTSVTNSGNGTLRTVSYGYTTNANGQINLTSVTDPESKTSSFGYDTNHQIIAQSNALGQLVVSNLYDGFGRVTTQYTQGDTSKTWQIYASGWNTVVADPAGGQQEYFFDDKTRQIALKDALGNVSQTFYDGQDHVVMTISPLNETNELFFDSNNNLVATIDPLGFGNSLIYDTSFNLIHTGDALNHTNSFAYNSHFQLTTSTDATGVSVTNGYDSGTGLLASRADAGGTTSYGYDSYGQLSSVTYPNSLGTIHYSNNALGDVLVITNALGITNGFQYNLRRQVIQTGAPTNLTTKIVYDAVGNVATNTDALTNSTVFTWSPTRHLLMTTLPATLVITNTYDSRDWLIKTLDPLQQPTTNGYDLAGRLLSVTDPLMRTTQMSYDNDGRKLTVTNALMQGISQQYDKRGQLVDTVDQMGQNIYRTNDTVGNQILFTNRLGKVWHFNYDAANRLTNTTTPTTKSDYSVFEQRGLLQTYTDFMVHTTTFGHDALGRLTSRADAVGTTMFVYDLNGNLATNAEGSQALVRQFDAYDRLSTYTDAATNQIKYGYDSNGNLTSLIYPGGRGVTYAYDNLNRLTTVTDWASKQTTYTYDLDSRVTSITRPNGTVRSNFYDVAGQLTNITEQAASHAPIAFFAFHYDLAGRVQWEFMAPTNLPYTPPSRTSTFDDDNRLATFKGPTMGSAASVTMDANGNMTVGPGTNDTFTNYVYDVRNRLTSAGGVTNTYDPANNRVAFTNMAGVTSFVIDPASSQMLMRIKGNTTNYYVYGLGLIYEVDETATTSKTATYHYDCRGSTVALTDNNGNVTDRIQYSAYGMTTFRGGTNDTPFLYNGKYGVQTDPNGLLYMRARYYNPYICRFLNADPSGFTGGMNMYAFADGNPISMTDPFGLGAVGELPGSSWMDDIASGLGIDNSIGAQVQRQDDLVGLVNFSTLGLANDASTAFTQHDLQGNLATSQEQVASAVMLGLAVIPGADVEAAGSKVAMELGEVAAENTVRFSRVGGEAGDFIAPGEETLQAAFRDPSMYGTRLTTTPTFNATLDPMGQVTGRGLNASVEIGPNAFGSRADLIQTIIHEETHIRLDLRAAQGSQRAIGIQGSLSSEEGYVESVTQRYWRMYGGR